MRYFCIVCGQRGADDRDKRRLNCHSCGTEDGMITVDDMRDVDQEVSVLPKSQWMHRNNIVYEVVGITNYNSDNPKYPPTVVYRGVQNKRLWSRPLNDWHRSMRLFKEVKP